MGMGMRTRARVLRWSREERRGVQVGGVEVDLRVDGGLDAYTGGETWRLGRVVVFMG